MLLKTPRILVINLLNKAYIPLITTYEMPSSGSSASSGNLLKGVKIILN